MEFKITNYTLPEAISFNYEELKNEISEKCKLYEAMVYTDEKIKEAKQDKANLNKFKKALNDERIRREKEYMVPFNEFKAQVNELIAIIDQPIAAIDSQVKTYEEKQRAEKLEKIKEYFAEANEYDWLNLEMIFDSRWLNASVSLKKVKEDITEILKTIAGNLVTLSNLPEFGFEATEVYKETLNINSAIEKAQRMAEIQKAKAEAEEKRRQEEEARKKAEEEAKLQKTLMTPSEEPAPVQQEAIPESAEPEREWISFKAFVTREQALALRNFFIENGIEFGRA